MILCLKKGILISWEKWEWFWFACKSSRNIRLFRVLFSIILFFAFLSRSSDLEFFYSNYGIVSSEVFSDDNSGIFRFSIFQIFSGKIAILASHFLLLLSLVFLCFGIFPRYFSLCALLLHLSFVHRNSAVIYGLDSIASYYLLYLIFADHYIDRPQTPMGSAAFRLAQIQLCIIYGYSGIQKLRGLAWWQGEALWGVLGNDQITRWNLSWVSHFPLLLSVADYLVLAWEIYFPVLIWKKSLRRWVLICGLALHLSIALTLNLTFFALLMISTYALFLSSQELDLIEKRMSQIIANFKLKILKSN